MDSGQLGDSALIHAIVIRYRFLECSKRVTKDTMWAMYHEVGRVGYELEDLRKEVKRRGLKRRKLRCLKGIVQSF